MAPKPLQQSTTRYDSATSLPLSSLPPSDSEGEEPEGDPRLLARSKNSDAAQECSIAPSNFPKTGRPTTNGALLKGKMFCIGNRAGYDADVLFAPYHPIQGVSKELYRLFLSKLPNFGKSIGTRYSTFADYAFLEAHNQLVDLGIPPLASNSKDTPPTIFDFAGNFAFTFNNFYNKPHTDNDKGKVYCVWYPIDSVSGKIVTMCEGFVLEGGWFLFPAYRIAFNFGAKYAAQIAWSGKSTFHQTMASKEEDTLNKQGKKVHYTRLGCSSQITMSLAVAAAKRGTDEQWNGTSNCERDVLDCQDLLKDLERKWKE
ncbi:uncharacterized protein MELLADRAFT_89239 [Melampsora larici-populina 98AG31]|uniref:Tet-like 2OG-Fe(II) oxygenase domain-containing protein n=1 Tax=Melampsora larici-populina (strain 98AG31 / pathotype 3-4-7) TaxID=747676 RepID=F4R5G5_MELLP|nr:uncharacterized protein MELLADRAFT_89239 [Melampsora larici-populina 98AG31]EGG12043.1 hypothetical protein MELLADRAFT_89239 [Melampsora larici-populina 98AG31]